MSLWDKLFEKREEKQKEFDLVSRLVEETFGKGFKPDYIWVPDNKKLCILWGSTGYPATIAKPVSAISDVMRDEVAGNFVRKKGSVLNVDEEYIKSGLAYARRYEEETGKKVSLEISRMVKRGECEYYENKIVNLKIV